MEKRCFRKKYKIIFIDIDDTLNPSNGKVSQYTKDVMTRLKENGIKVVIDTNKQKTNQLG